MRSNIFIWILINFFSSPRKNLKDLVKVKTPIFHMFLILFRRFDTHIFINIIGFYY